MYALSTPALDGQPVTDGHARYCQDNGHMSYTVDGADKGWCPRCGESTVPTPVNPDFVRAVKLEESITGARIVASFGMNDYDKSRAYKTMNTHRKELFTMIDGWSTETRRAFGEYRKTH